MLNMDEITELLDRLQQAGIHIPPALEKAMKIVNIEEFTNFDCEAFFHDRPIVFLETITGGVKTISAPHMIVTLIHYLELDLGQEVVVYGAKGGYICALIAHIIGSEGKVTVLDPSKEVLDHLNRTLIGYPTISCHQIGEKQIELTNLNRVLVTGHIEELPDWITNGLAESGFVIAPIGDSNAQTLLKLEKQADQLLETNLGSVLFGPVNIEDSIITTPSPEEMATLVEQVVELMGDMSLIKNEDKSRLYDLVAQLRQLPDDLPPPEEFDDPSEHPMMKLMMSEGGWFMRFWPVVQLMVESRLQAPGAPNQDEFNSDHSDFIP